MALACSYLLCDAPTALELWACGDDDDDDVAIITSPFLVCPVSVPYALCPVPRALSPLSCALCPEPCVLCPVPWTLCPEPGTLCPVPWTLCPEPGALCPVPCTLHPVPRVFQIWMSACPIHARMERHVGIYSTITCASADQVTQVPFAKQVRAVQLRLDNCFTAKMQWSAWKPYLHAHRTMPVHALIYFALMEMVSCKCPYQNIT